MATKNETIGDFLSEHDKLTTKIKRINKNIQLLSVDLDYFIKKNPQLNNVDDTTLLAFFEKAFDMCDAESPNYDVDFCADMTRLGLKTDVFYGSRVTPGLYDDGIGHSITSIYDDNVDHANDLEYNKGQK